MLCAGFAVELTLSRNFSKSQAAQRFDIIMPFERMLEGS